MHDFFFSMAGDGDRPIMHLLFSFAFPYVGHVFVLITYEFMEMNTDTDFPLLVVLWVTTV